MIQNKYYAIDAHCHIYPSKIALLAIHHTDDFYGEHSSEKGVGEHLIESANINGIDKCLVQSVATTKKQVRKINEFIKGEVEKSNGKFIGLGTIHPESEDMKGDILHLIDLGLKGIKIHPDIQETPVDSKGFIKAYEICESLNVPILMHTGDNRYDNSNPNRLVPILKEFKNLTVIGAHFGGWSIWTEAVKHYAEFTNFYVDCSSSFHYLKDDEIKAIIKGYGVNKVLFGTDYPMWNAKSEIERLLSLNLTDQEYELIFSKNAQKVFKI